MAAKKGGRRRRIRVIVVTAAIVVVAVAGYFAYRTSHSTASAAIKYTTEAAQKMTLTSSVSGTGNIVLGSSSTVSPSVSGTVSGLAVKVGDKVTKGQVLFTIVNAQLDLAVQNAQNSYNQAVNSLSQAQLSVLQAKKNLSDLKDPEGRADCECGSRRQRHGRRQRHAGSQRLGRRRRRADSKRGSDCPGGTIRGNG